MKHVYSLKQATHMNKQQRSNQYYSVANGNEKSILRKHTKKLFCLQDSFESTPFCSWMDSIICASFVSSPFATFVIRSRSNRRDDCGINTKDSKYAFF